MMKNKTLFTIIIGIFLLLASPGGAEAKEECNGPLCATNRTLVPQSRVPYNRPTVCIRVIGPPGEVANILFRENQNEAPYRTYSKTIGSEGLAEFLVGRHWVVQAQALGHLINACDKGGFNGERLEAHDVAQHLQNGSNCISVPLCVLEGGAGCPPNR